MPYATLGYALAMRVLQSDLYPTLDELERAECDELIARGADRVTHRVAGKPCADCTTAVECQSIGWCIGSAV